MRAAPAAKRITPPRILITRAPHQASALADALRSIGANPILIPTIELVGPTSFAALDAALTHLDNFHWLLFTSSNAVSAFHRRIEARALGSEHASRPKVAAIGRATADALAAISLPADLIPSEAVAESLTKALLPNALQPDGSPTRYLLIRAEEARDHLPENLRAAGAEVTIAPAYRNVVPEGSINAFKTLFSASNAPLDAIVFTSSSTVKNLFGLLEKAGIQLPSTTELFSFGPVTSATVRNFGHQVALEASEATISALVRDIAKHLGHKPAVSPD